MVTAADGAEKFYATITGEARYESVDEAKEKDELLRHAYMGHQKWFLIKNTDCKDFKDKIQKTKEAVLDTLGKSAGTHFHKKFLLKKQAKPDSSAIPLDLSSIDFYEEITVSETFIDFVSNEGEVLACSVEKKGNKNSFTYTHKLALLKQNQKILKKKNISAAEYIAYKSQKKKDTSTMRSKRICVIDNGIYVIIDYFNETDGQPMLGIIQVKDIDIGDIELPSFIKTHREITDEQQYLPEIMCKENYYMDEQDKKGTN